jgi:hypothetical protein
MEQITAEQIHQEFYSAEDRLLDEAKDLIENPKIKQMLRAERFSKIGFSSAKPVKEMEEIFFATQKASKTISAIEYFRIHYPNNKFITEDEVVKICKKYALLLGDAVNYIGDIPEKNLYEIEHFKLRKEDYTPKEDLLSGFTGLIPFILHGGQSSVGFDIAENINSSQSTVWDRWLRTGGGDAFFNARGKQIEVAEKNNHEQAKFKICAPQKDFNTAGYEIKDGYCLVWDPVVLQPVKGGYLIVTAWGPEASDEIIVNQIKN